MLKRAIAAIGVLMLIGAALFYVYYDRELRYYQDTNDARIESDQVTISSKLAGYVRAVAVDDNQKVAAGALLIEVDPVDYRTRLDAARADAASALAAQGASQATQEEGLAAVGQAQAALVAAQADLDFAERELRRFIPLVNAGAEPDTRLSQIVADRDRAKAQLAARSAALEQARRRVESIGAQTRQLATRVTAAQVQEQAAANDLSHTALVAPVAGRIAGRTVRVGQFVQPGQPLLTVVPAESLYVVANFKETQIGLMRPGQPAKIKVDALPGVEFAGTVTSVTPGTGANFSLIKPENATGNFTKIVQRVPVRIRIDAGPSARKVLVPGMSLEVDVDTRASRNEIDAIRNEQAKASR